MSKYIVSTWNVGEGLSRGERNKVKGNNAHYGAQAMDLVSLMAHHLPCELSFPLKKRESPNLLFST